MKAALAVTSAVALMSLAGCGGGSSSSASDPDAGGFSAAADTSTCLKDATAVTSTPDGYPTDFPLPAKTVVYNVEDRGDAGVIATGVTSLPFKQVLAALNGPAQKAGFKVTNGETEEDDAEANWTGNGFTGRWSIKKSATCPGETVVQLLSTKS